MDNNTFIGNNMIFLGLVLLFICLYLLQISSIVRKAKGKNPEVKSRYRRLVLDKVSSSIFNASTVLFIFSITAFLLLVFAFKILDVKDGNYIVSLSSIFSSLLIVVTLIITHNQNKKSNENFEESQIESKIQFAKEREENKKQFDEQLKFFQKQQFESTFFNMMKQLEDIVSNLMFNEQIVTLKQEKFINSLGQESLLPVVENITSTGREVFKYLYKSIKVIYFDKIKTQELNSDDVNRFPKIDQIIKSAKTYYLQPIGYENVISELGIKGFESIKDFYVFDHYYQYLYQIMKFVDEATFLDKHPQYIDERYKYMALLRATLSPYELVFLFYNDLSRYGNEKVKPLIERYSFFKSLRKELLANTKIDYDLNCIKDDFNSDYDRYKTDIKGNKRKYYTSAFVKDKKLFNHTN